jgi:4-hydroxybenzoate polyprenyltransferase
VGIKSTALHLGDRTKTWLSGFAGAHVACLAASGYAAQLSWPFYAGLALGGLHLAWQIRTVDLDSPRDCMATFVSNKWYGGIVFAAIVSGRLAASPV